MSPSTSWPTALKRTMVGGTQLKLPLRNDHQIQAHSHSLINYKRKALIYMNIISLAQPDTSKSTITNHPLADACCCRMLPNAPANLHLNPPLPSRAGRRVHLV